MSLKNYLGSYICRPYISTYFYFTLVKVHYVVNHTWLEVFEYENKLVFFTCYFGTPKCLEGSI